MADDEGLLTADVCEEIFHKCLAEGDVKGCEAALRVMAVRDPYRAEMLLDLTRFALSVARRNHAVKSAADYLPKEH